MPNNSNELQEELEENFAEGNPPKGIEREVLGKWTVFLRNLGGILAVMVVCVTAVFNSYTVNISVTEYGKWPSESAMLIMMVGPIICAWQFLNVSKIITTILGGDGVKKIRARLANTIHPDKDNP